MIEFQERKLLVLEAKFHCLHNCYKIDCVLVPQDLVPLGMFLQFALEKVIALSKHQRVGLLDSGLQHRLALDVQVEFALEYHVGDHFFWCKVSGIIIG